jgi:diadenosine tetraphosphate (Ap4A) HIT family hydrolase
MAAGFSLHPRLAADTAFVADWVLTHVLVMNDCRYPWLILVPRRKDVSELFDLDLSDRALMIEEVARAGAVLKRLTGAAKLNVGALGNVVSQLHVHLVARNPSDAAWPGPVWGHGVAQPYEPSALSAFVGQLQSALN